MKIIVTGAAGQLGNELKVLLSKNDEVIYWDINDVDITNYEQIHSAVSEVNPEVIINASAYTAVDKAENETEKAYSVNCEGARNIALVAKEFRSRLIHISTDFIFNGKKSEPYLINDKPDPLNVYGKSKLEGEIEVKNILDQDATIIRTAWVYSAFGVNFVKTMLNLMNSRDALKVVSDQVGTPTWAGGLGKAIIDLLNKDAVGLFHWTDSGEASWYDFAIAIYEEALQTGHVRKNIEILPIKTSEYPTSAIRPKYSVLDKTKICEVLGYTPEHWRVNLRHMLSQLPK